MHPVRERSPAFLVVRMGRSNWLLAVAFQIVLGHAVTLPEKPCSRRDLDLRKDLVDHPAFFKSRSHVGHLVARLAICLFLVGCRRSESSLFEGEAARRPKAGQADEKADASGPSNETAKSAPSANLPLPPIEPATPVAKLTPAQQGILCDWVADRLGGYRLSTDCGGGRTVTNFANQADCIVGYLGFACPITVGQVAKCANAQSASHGCAFPRDECSPLLCGK